MRVKGTPEIWQKFPMTWASFARGSMPALLLERWGPDKCLAPAKPQQSDTLREWQIRPKPAMMRIRHDGVAQG